MKGIETKIRNLTENAIRQHGSPGADLPEITISATRPEFEGDLTIVCFPFTRMMGKSPEQTGLVIGEYLLEHCPEIARFNVVKGFLNLSVQDRAWLAEFWNLTQGPGFQARPKNNRKIMVEFSSPNTNKPLHLGHIRNIFLGAALSEIMEFSGFEVVRTNLINDRGIHICKSMVAYKRQNEGQTPEKTGIKGDHLVGQFYVLYNQIFSEEVNQLVAGGMTKEEAEEKAPVLLEARRMLQEWEQGNPDVISLWKTMNDWVYAGFESTYRRMGIHFDQYYYESKTYLLGKDMVQEGLHAGVFYQKEDGSVWIDLSGEGLDHKLVQRADGTSVYITQDMGTADLKYQDHRMERSVYVVGNEQDYHFEVLFHILKKMNRAYAWGLFHLSYGMVDLPTGKMKSREGTVVDADELMDEVVATAREKTAELGKIADFDASELEKLYEVLGIGAIRYFLLKVDPKKRMLFNPEESISLQGNTATAIQYTHARISSICRKAGQAGIGLRLNHMPPALAATEKEMLLHLLRFDDALAEAVQNYAPSILANYLYECSRLYNAFFAHETIFQAETPQQVQFRVALSHHTGEAIRACGKMLGIEMPERM
jgi:arginyl-tRNA synthetase